MNVRRVGASLAVVMIATAINPIIGEASTNFNLRKKVIGVSGIMNVTSINTMVTRGNFPICW